MLHFGERDRSIPLSEVERIREAYPEGIYHLYAAGHAFSNHERPQNYDAAATTLAGERTAAFLAQYIG
jgi:carboxymethylenebutenolidase